MQRINVKDLEGVVKRLNKLTGSPETSWTRSKDGKYTANIGNYHLDGAYGAWTLYRMDTAGGGVQDVLHCGHVSKRELYSLIHAYINGLEAKGQFK